MCKGNNNKHTCIGTCCDCIGVWTEACGRVTMGWTLRYTKLLRGRSCCLKEAGSIRTKDVDGAVKAVDEEGWETTGCEGKLKNTSFNGGVGNLGFLQEPRFWFVMSTISSGKTFTSPSTLSRFWTLLNGTTFIVDPSLVFRHAILVSPTIWNNQNYQQ